MVGTRSQLSLRNTVVGNNSSNDKDLNDDTSTTIVVSPVVIAPTELGDGNGVIRTTKIASETGSVPTKQRKKDKPTVIVVLDKSTMSTLKKNNNKKRPQLYVQRLL